MQMMQGTTSISLAAILTAPGWRTAAPKETAPASGFSALRPLGRVIVPIVRIDNRSTPVIAICSLYSPALFHVQFVPFPICGWPVFGGTQ